MQPLHLTNITYPDKSIPTNLATNCLSVFDHFSILALKGLKPTLETPKQVVTCFLMFSGKVGRGGIESKHV